MLGHVYKIDTILLFPQLISGEGTAISNYTTRPPHQGQLRHSGVERILFGYQLLEDALNVLNYCILYAIIDYL